ncbi:MAG: hypothetical protein H0W83_16200 [Planctomycetes bacterium]|nr:hypothetical protein [Planctomycetota bacterium]
MRSPAGIEHLRVRMRAYVQRSLGVLTSIHAQGAIIVDLEGLEHGGGYYHADPRRLSTLAPEMEGISDEILSTLRGAGLRVGVAVAPQVDGDEDSQAQDLAESMAYAKQRWGTTLALMLGTPSHPQQFPGRLIGLAAMAHRDVLLISMGAYRDSSESFVPMRDPDKEGWTEDQTHPHGGFSAIYVVDRALRQPERVRAALAAGDIALVRGWFEDPGVQLIRGWTHDP